MDGQSPSMLVTKRRTLVVAILLGMGKVSTTVQEHIGPQHSRALGCLLGQYIGDALGTRYEFKKREYVRKMIEEDRDSTGFLPILGGGPFGLEKGQVTDDTELAMALANSLLEMNCYDHAAVASAYKAWMDSSPFDIGNTTKNAFNVPAGDTKSVLEAILRQARERNGGSLSNGCLMRISPLAIAGVFWSVEDLARSSKMDALLTNPHSDAQAAVASYTAAVSELIRSGSRHDAYQAGLDAAKDSTLVTSWLKAAEQGSTDVLMKDGKYAQSDTWHMGYIGVAFQWAFYEMLHASSFEEGLVRVISRGGDTDTNGCICGAMLGAMLGVQGIPRKWVETVECRQPRAEKCPWVNSTGLLEKAKKLLHVES